MHKWLCSHLWPSVSSRRLSGMKSTVMIWRSWVRTPVGSVCSTSVLKSHLIQKYKFLYLGVMNVCTPNRLRVPSIWHPYMSFSRFKLLPINLFNLATIANQKSNIFIENLEILSTMRQNWLMTKQAWEFVNHDWCSILWRWKKCTQFIMQAY